MALIGIDWIQPRQFSLFRYFLKIFEINLIKNKSKAPDSHHYQALSC